MNNPNPNPNRVIHELRATGVPAETPSPLRSGVHCRGYLPHVKREGVSHFATVSVVLLLLPKHEPVA
jgi:hypothetical protein